MPEDSTQKKAAMPGTAAAAAAFDRELFRDALYTRSLNVQTSARAAIIPTGEDIVTPRALTDRGPRVELRNLEPTTPRTRMAERALHTKAEPRARLSDAEILNLRDGPEGRPITRLPERKWFLSQKHSQRARDTEYAKTYCHENPREQLDEMLNMTYNDRRVQRETKLNLADYQRSELRTAMMGWGPQMRQIYVPEIKTDSDVLHQHYKALGIPHEYTKNGDVEILPENSPALAERTLLPARPSTEGSAFKRPSIKALQGASPVDGGSSLRSTVTRPDGSPNMAATEYRGQFCKNVSMDGTIERTQVFMDGPVDFDQPDDLEQTKLAIRQRHTRESEVYNKYKDLVHAKDEARRDNISVEEVYKKQLMTTLNDPYGTVHGSPKYHRPIPTHVKTPARISHIATLQKDLAWQPDGILQSLTGKAGPCQVTSHRKGFYGIQQAHSPRRSLKWGHTRKDRKPFYSLEVNVESKSMGFEIPAPADRVQRKFDKPQVEPKVPSSSKVVPQRVSGLLNKP